MRGLTSLIGNAPTGRTSAIASDCPICGAASPIPLLKRCTEDRSPIMLSKEARTCRVGSASFGKLRRRASARRIGSSAWRTPRLASWLRTSGWLTSGTGTMVPTIFEYLRFRQVQHDSERRPPRMRRQYIEPDDPEVVETRADPRKHRGCRVAGRADGIRTAATSGPPAALLGPMAGSARQETPRDPTDL
jgi:hypothetical protein